MYVSQTGSVELISSPFVQWKLQEHLGEVQSKLDFLSSLGMFEMLAVILNLGDLEFESLGRNSTKIVDSDPMDNIARLLQVNCVEISLSMSCALGSLCLAIFDVLFHFQLFRVVQKSV